MSQKDYKLEVMKELMKKDNHLRGLAKSLNINQTTISRKTEELCDENILDFRTEGRNKVFFIKKSLEARQYIQILEVEKLREILKRYPFLRGIFEKIKNNKKIRLAVLFGSYSKGLAKKESDIDIYIDTTSKEIKKGVEILNSRISVKIGKYNKESILIKEIEKNHIIIKGVEVFYEKNKIFN